MITPFAVIKDQLISSYRSCTCGKYFQRACHLSLAAALVGGVAMAGCSPRYHDMPEYWPIPTKEYDNYGPGRFKTALLAAQIDRYYRSSAPGPIGVTTFVNIDDLYASSTFGRMVGEQLMSELAMKGFDVVELRHADALQFLDTSGEFALSRDVRAVRGSRNLAAVVVGTYVVSPERVYVNARLIEPSTSLVLSAGSVEMSKTRELAKLLRGGSMPGSLERIPVKHLGYSDRSPLDAMRRSWMMEESGPETLSNRGAPLQQPLAAQGLDPQTMPEASLPKVGDANQDSDPQPSTPKVLGEAEAGMVEKPRLSIGLGR
ncbi:MAG: FlgO family outer membrane protein [Pseudomonadota bacterium]|jgi:TolB-like protein